MLPFLSSRLGQVVLLAILALEGAHATFGHSTSSKVKSGEKCGIGWNRGGGGGGGGGGGRGHHGGGGQAGGEGGQDGTPKKGKWGGGGGRKGKHGGWGGEGEMSIPAGEIPEMPTNAVGGGAPPAPPGTETVGGGAPVPTPVTSSPVSEEPDLPISPEAPPEAVDGGAPPSPPIESPPSAALSGEQSAGAESNAESESDSLSINNVTNIVNNESNTENVSISNSTTVTKFEEWKSTSITLMISIDLKRVEVAEIAVNVDISAQAGEYEVPQAPWLSCAGESFYYRFTSSAGTVEYTEEFTIEGKDSDLTKSCVEEKAVPKVTESPKGLEWQALNNETFGYTIIQNVTNIFNQLITTVIDGEIVTQTVQKTVTETAAGATVTEAVQVATVSEVVTVTSIVNGGGSTVLATITSAANEAPPAISPDAISPDAISPDALSPTGIIPGDAAVPTSTSGSGGISEGDDEEWDDEWDDEDFSGSPSGTSSSASDSATPTAGSGLDDWDDGFGAASGRPRASIVLALASSVIAMIAGGLLLTV